MTIFLRNRDPEPGEVDVLRGVDVYLEIMESDGSDVDDSATQVYVEGVLAYDGGIFQPGFDGPGSTSSSFHVGVRRITIDPTTDFLSEQVVDVCVVSQNVGATEFLNDCYSFTIEDFTPPAVINVIGLTPRVLQVTFDEEVKGVDPTSIDDALNPANYTLTPLPEECVPAVTPIVVSVEVSGGSFNLTLDIDITHGVEYQLDVVNVEDVHENVIAGAGSEYRFTYVLPVPVGRDFDLWRMVPTINRLEDDSCDLLKFIRCIQEPTDLLLYQVDKFIDLIDPDTAPEDFVDAMLADLGNPFSFALDLNSKRKLVRVLVPIYRQKGLKRGIINAIRFFVGIEVEVDSFFGDDGWILGESELGIDTELGPGDRALLYTFVIISPVELTDAQRDQMTRIANYMKPAHTHLKWIVEPEPPPPEPDHWELGVSELGDTTLLH